MTKIGFVSPKGLPALCIYYDDKAKKTHTGFIRNGKKLGLTDSVPAENLLNSTPIFSPALMRFLIIAGKTTRRKDKIKPGIKDGASWLFAPSMSRI